jgi:hypothetical protein
MKTMHSVKSWVSRSATGRVRLLLPLVLGACALAMVACPAKTGSYAPIDWAYEMHYAPSYRSQEPPHLAPPVGAVPYKSAGDSREYTRDIAYSEAEYTAMESPIPRTEVSLARAVELYRVNCSFCHGPMGEVTGPVGKMMGAPTMMQDVTMGRPIGQFFMLISQGGTNKTRGGMPRFSSLLSVEDRWLLADYIMLLQGR